MNVASFAQKTYLLDISIYHKSNEFPYQQLILNLLANKKQTLYNDAIHVSLGPIGCRAFDFPNVTFMPLLWGKGHGEMREPTKEDKKV